MVPKADQDCLRCKALEQDAVDDAKVKSLEQKCNGIIIALPSLSHNCLFGPQGPTHIQVQHQAAVFSVRN